jgi:hypothetical protein
MAPVELVASVGGKQHHPAVRQPPRDVVEQVARGAVGPVDVIENEKQPTIASPQLEERDDRLEEPQFCLRGIP